MYKRQVLHILAAAQEAELDFTMADIDRLSRRLPNICKVAPASVAVNKPVKISGTAGPLPALAAAKVAVKIERKAGKKWVKAKAATAKVGATGAFTLTYKPTKKGSYQVTASIAKTSSFTAKTLKKTFKAK